MAGDDIADEEFELVCTRRPDEDDDTELPAGKNALDGLATDRIECGGVAWWLVGTVAGF